ncbi:MAG: ribosome recycling factor, partial [Bdellovibrionales bacterium]
YLTLYAFSTENWLRPESEVSFLMRLLGRQITKDARVAVRMARRDANEALKATLKAKEISEDESKSATEVIQKMTDDFIKKIDHIGTEKENELMTI